MRCAWLISSVLLPCLLAESAESGGQVNATGPNICGISILAPSGKVLFLPSAAGGLEAVALFNGKMLWESKAASRLLLATDEKVFAQALVKGKRNQVMVVVVDARTGERLLQSDVIAFPDWVAVPRDYGLSFRSAGRLEKGDLVLAWQARAFHEGGEPLPEFGPDGKPYVDPNAKEAGGAVRVNLSTGRATAVKDYRPKETEFPEDRPSWAGQTKRQGWVFRVEEKSPDPGFPYTLTRRTLKAKTEDGKRSWERHVAGDVYLPLRP